MRRLHEAIRRADELTLFRVCFGLAMAAWALVALVGGQVETELRRPVFHFHYSGFNWVLPPRGQLLTGVFAALTIASGLLALGRSPLSRRVAAGLLAVGLSYVLLLEETLFGDSAWLAVLIAVIFALSPSRPALWALRGQLAVVTLAAALSKLSTDWLLGEPMGYWLYTRRQLPFLGPMLDSALARLVFSWGWFLAELAIIPALLWRRTKVPAALACLLLAFAQGLASQSLSFFWVVPSLCLLYVRAPVRLFPPRSTTSAAVALALMLELCFALRHLAYPGMLAWHEQGRFFSWSAGLWRKESRIQFKTYDAEARREIQVNPNTFLSKRQLARMKAAPDRVQEFARFLSRVLSQGQPERRKVFVVHRVSLNGRRPELLVDPAADLATRRRRWFVFPDYLLPLTEPLPESGRLETSR